MCPRSAALGFQREQTTSTAALVDLADLLINARAGVNVMHTCRSETLLDKADKKGYTRLRQLIVAKGAKR